MNKTEKNFNVNALPVSKKAYLRLVARIDKAFEFYHEQSVPNAVMIAALNRYLIGDVEVIDQLPPALYIAFQFVMQDADMAVERSRKARERARLRRESRVAAFAGSTESIETSEPADVIGRAVNTRLSEAIDTSMTADCSVTAEIACTTNAPESIEITDATDVTETVESSDKKNPEHFLQKHPSNRKRSPQSREYERYSTSFKKEQRIRKVKIRHLMSKNPRPARHQPSTPGLSS